LAAEDFRTFFLVFFNSFKLSFSSAEMVTHPAGTVLP